MVCTSRLGSSFSYAELIFDFRPVPAIDTHRSRGNDKIAACDVDGSMRISMIVSDRLLLTSPKPPAYGEFGSTHASLRLSDPTSRKFMAGPLTACCAGRWGGRRKASRRHGHGLGRGVMVTLCRSPTRS